MREPARGRSDDDAPAVLEVFSNSARVWFVALVVDARDGVLTLRFIDKEGAKCEKSAYLEDPRVAVFGKHTAGLLPPDVVAVPSASRPGAYSYLDPVAQKKYATPELVWQAYLERQLLDDSAPPSVAAPPPLQRVPEDDYLIPAASAGDLRGHLGGTGLDSAPQDPGWSRHVPEERPNAMPHMTAAPRIVMEDHRAGLQERVPPITSKAAAAEEDSIEARMERQLQLIEESLNSPAAKAPLPHEAEGALLAAPFDFGYGCAQDVGDDLAHSVDRLPSPQDDHASPAGSQRLDHLGHLDMGVDMGVDEASQACDFDDIVLDRDGPMEDFSPVATPLGDALGAGAPQFTADGRLVRQQSPGRHTSSRAATTASPQLAAARPGVETQMQEESSAEYVKTPTSPDKQPPGSHLHDLTNTGRARVKLKSMEAIMAEADAALASAAPAPGPCSRVEQPQAAKPEGPMIVAAPRQVGSAEGPKIMAAPTVGNSLGARAKALTALPTAQQPAAPAARAVPSRALPAAGVPARAAAAPVSLEGCGPRIVRAAAEGCGPRITPAGAEGQGPRISSGGVEGCGPRVVPAAAESCGPRVAPAPVQSAPRSTVMVRREVQQEERQPPAEELHGYASREEEFAGQPDRSARPAPRSSDGYTPAASHVAPDLQRMEMPSEPYPDAGYSAMRPGFDAAYAAHEFRSSAADAAPSRDDEDASVGPDRQWSIDGPMHRPSHRGGAADPFPYAAASEGGDDDDEEFFEQGAMYAHYGAPGQPDRGFRTPVDSDLAEWTAAEAHLQSGLGAAPQQYGPAAPAPYHSEVVNEATARPQLPSQAGLGLDVPAIASGVGAAAAAGAAGVGAAAAAGAAAAGAAVSSAAAAAAGAAVSAVATSGPGVAVSSAVARASQFANYIAESAASTPVSMGDDFVREQPGERGRVPGFTGLPMVQEEEELLHRSDSFESFRMMTPARGGMPGGTPRQRAEQPGPAAMRGFRAEEEIDPRNWEEDALRQQARRAPPRPAARDVYEPPRPVRERYERPSQGPPCHEEQACPLAGKVGLPAFDLPPGAVRTSTGQAAYLNRLGMDASDDSLAEGFERLAQIEIERERAMMFAEIAEEEDRHQRVSVETERRRRAVATEAERRRLLELERQRQFSRHRGPPADFDDCALGQTVHGAGVLSVRSAPSAPRLLPAALPSDAGPERLMRGPPPRAS
eukprot:TRINITY_DN58771_c0_g1_i1.p1 TRINITY_DN58771_c0_g1~~TRINITY_DN58771_c0_g1_i1.p1  ORF type:complete len:1216 (+),score=259.60 TRINITY_DN58771_c0_g1_i1:53-3649(+)